MIAFADPTLTEIGELFETFKQMSGSSEAAGSMLLAYAMLKRPGGSPTLNQVEDAIVPAGDRQNHWITCAEMATCERISVKEVRARIRSGKIKAKKVKGVWRVEPPPIIDVMSNVHLKIF